MKIFDVNKDQKLLYLIWIISLISTFGSLFFSEIMKYPPCILCWYQRIAIYPIVIIAPIALLAGEARCLMKYVLGLALWGLLFAIYHNLLYWGVIPETLAPCKEGVSCSTQPFVWFGFVTIPLLSLLSFLGIICFVFLSLKKGKNL